MDRHTNVFGINYGFEINFNSVTTIDFDKIDDGWVDSGRVISFENALKKLG